PKSRCRPRRRTGGGCTLNPTSAKLKRSPNGPGEDPAWRKPMFSRSLPRVAGLSLRIFVMMTMPARADALKDEIAPTGKLRVANATYIVKAGSPATNFATLDQPGIKVAAVNNTTTMRGAIAHLKNAKVTGYQTYDEIFNLLKNGEIDAFALSRDQLYAMAKKIPGTRVLDETFKQTVTAVAAPPNHPLALAFASKFLTEATANGTLPKAYDNNGMKDSPIRTQTK